MLLLRTLLAAACLAALTSTCVSSSSPHTLGQEMLQATQSPIGEFRVALVQAMPPQSPAAASVSHEISAAVKGPLVEDSELLDPESRARLRALSALQTRLRAAYSAAKLQAENEGRFFVPTPPNHMMDFHQHHEFQQLGNRLQEMRAYVYGIEHRNDPNDNSRCVERFRHAMARQHDFSWTEEKVQAYIHNHRLDLSDPKHENPSSHGTHAECEQVLRHALAIRSGKVQLPVTHHTNSAGWPHMRELSAHREFHPANRDKRLDSHELKERQNERAVWQQYLNDVARLEEKLRTSRTHQESGLAAHANDAEDDLEANANSLDNEDEVDFDSALATSQDSFDSELMFDEFDDAENQAQIDSVAMNNQPAEAPAPVSPRRALHVQPAIARGRHAAEEAAAQARVAIAAAQDDDRRRGRDRARQRSLERAHARERSESPLGHAGAVAEARIAALAAERAHRNDPSFAPRLGLLNPFASSLRGPPTLQQWQMHQETPHAVSRRQQRDIRLEDQERQRRPMPSQDERVSE